MSEYTGKKVSTFQERFTELCDSSPMNDAAIADALHVSRQTVCSWKSGTRSPKLPTVQAIANHFCIDVAWLMGFDVKRDISREEAFENEYTRAEKEMRGDQPKNDEIRFLIRGLNKMTPEQIEQATSMMRIMFAKYFKEDDDAT